MIKELNGALTGLGDANRIRGHSGSDSLLFFFFAPPLRSKVVVRFPREW